MKQQVDVRNVILVETYLDERSALFALTSNGGRRYTNTHKAQLRSYQL